MRLFGVPRFTSYAKPERWAAQANQARKDNESRPTDLHRWRRLGLGECGLVMITCYLDSQDYSTLTDPKQASAERHEIRSALLALAHSHQVRFVFSAAVVSEAVPLTADATYLAELRGDFLTNLCGSNALVFFDKLVEAEARALSRRSSPPSHVLDKFGRWFPDFDDDGPPQSFLDVIRESAEKEWKSMGLSRQQRRANSRALIKHGKPRAELRAHLESQDPKAIVAEIQEKYPMRPDYAAVITDYAFGRASETALVEALTNSLKDLQWMMKWFSTDHSLSNPIADIVRRPGRELGQLARHLVVTSLEYADMLREADLDADPTGPQGQLALRWKEMESSQLLGMVVRASRTRGIQLDEHSVAEVERYCPGITTGVKSLFSSIWMNVGGGRKKEPEDSQPVDALHAFYAPYVNVFRADRFMAPHIQNQCRNSGTIVVSRLAELVGVLQQQVR